MEKKDPNPKTQQTINIIKTLVGAKKHGLRAKFKLIAACFTIIILVSIVSSLFSSDKEVPKKKKFDKGDALIESFDYVRNRLKSPSTAEFGYNSETGVTQLNDSTFSVHNIVDSQNSFGAMIRTSYTCKIINHSNGIVNCEGLELLSW